MQCKQSHVTKFSVFYSRLWFLLERTCPGPVDLWVSALKSTKARKMKTSLCRAQVPWPVIGVRATFLLFSMVLHSHVPWGHLSLQSQLCHLCVSITSQFLDQVRAVSLDGITSVINISGPSCHMELQPCTPTPGTVLRSQQRQQSSQEGGASTAVVGK